MSFLRSIRQLVPGDSAKRGTSWRLGGRRKQEAQPFSCLPAVPNGITRQYHPSPRLCTQLQPHFFPRLRVLIPNSPSPSSKLPNPSPLVPAPLPPQCGWQLLPTLTSGSAQQSFFHSFSPLPPVKSIPMLIPFPGMPPVTCFPGCTPAEVAGERPTMMGFESVWLCPWSRTQYVPLSLEGSTLVFLGMQGDYPIHQVITWVVWDEAPSKHLLLLAMILLMHLFSRSLSVSSVGPRTRTFPQC